MNRTLKATAALMLMMVFAVGCTKPDEPNNGGNSGGGNNGNNDSDVRVTTYTPQDITANTAVCGGDVIAVQGLSLSGIGVCWSTENNPTIDDSHVFSEQWNEPFVRVIRDLEPETHYYVRAYALRGLMCYYGDVLSFTTLENNTNGNDTILECSPSIHVLQEVGYLQNGQLVDIGYDEQLTMPFGFVMDSNPQTNMALKHLKVDVEYFDLEGVSLDFFNWADKDIEGTSYTYEDIITFNLRDLIGRTVITAIVTDAAGETASASINLSINFSVPPLEVKQFTWIRRGSSFLNNTEEEMAEFGLYWSGNYKDVFATIKPLEGSILYVCNGDDFWNITTDVEEAEYLAYLSETTSPVVSYRNVAISNSANYNDLLVVREGDGDIHLILISRAEIENGSYGTQVSIMGEAK